MQHSFRYFLAALTACGTIQAAYFGNIVPIRGHVSDIVADPVRKLVYIANFTANRIEVLSTANQTLQSPIILASQQPSAVALSPNGQYLVAGHYTAGNPAPTGALTVVDLRTGVQQNLSLGNEAVLAVAFGNSPLALVVTTKSVSLFDPESRAIVPVEVKDFESKALPVPWATFPADIITGTSSVSGDGNVVCVTVDNGGTASVIKFDVPGGAVLLTGGAFSPPAGPRAISLDQTGSTYLVGWALIGMRAGQERILSQFPYPSGVLGQGSHVFDPGRNQIYAQVTPGTFTASAAGANTPALYQSFDADNLTVRETFQMRENLAGKSILFGDSVYAVSDSGITVFPMGALNQVHRVMSAQEDLFFQSNGCSQGVMSQFLDIVDPGGNATDFTLTSDNPGITFSPASGVTPARVRVLVDPSAFQDQKGTAAVPVTISSSFAVNVPAPVRVLVNTSNPDQKGAIYDVPGTIVDVLADPRRERFYVLRQDRNQVLVFDSGKMTQIATLRTGNTPMQMAIFQDLLLVTNDNSQFVNVYDLTKLTPSDPVYLPGALYGHSIVATGSTVLLTTRPAGGDPVLVSINVPNRIATKAATSIYQNKIDTSTVLAASPSGLSVFMAMPDGTVAIYDTIAHAFVASRKDVAALSGAYAAFSDELFFAGNTLFGPSLVPAGQVNLRGALSSGAATADNKGLLSMAPMTARNGAVERFALDTFLPVAPTPITEAPDLSMNARPVPQGQIGQTIYPFTRTLAPLAGGSGVIQLSTSGFTVLPWAFDAPSAQPVLRAITNAADQGATLAPGGLVTLWGDALSEGNAAASSLPLSGSLNNVCLFANSTPVPLLFVSPNQINAQLPFTAGATTDLTLVNSKGMSAPLRAAVQPAAPAIFRMGDGTPLVIRADNGRLIGDSNPILLDGKVIIYLTGLGAVSPDTQAGVAAPSSPLVTTSEKPRVYIGPVQLFTLWSGLAPGMVGVYQINAQVPFRDVSTGSKVQFTVIQGNAQTILHLPVRD